MSELTPEVIRNILDYKIDWGSSHKGVLAEGSGPAAEAYHKGEITEDQVCDFLHEVLEGLYDKYKLRTPEEIADEPYPYGEYNPNFGDDRVCECGHTYYRHFDTYEDMEPVGCKYCGCYEFKEQPEQNEEPRTRTEEPSQ